MLQRVFLSLCILGWISFANAVESNIIEIMQNLQYDSDLIQKGFFLDKNDLIVEGIEKHKKDIDMLRKFNIEVFLTQNNMNYAPIINSFLNNIVEQRILMERFLKNKDKIRAFEAYQELNLNCIKCHGLNRGW